jgi:hypothetical protein
MKLGFGIFSTGCKTWKMIFRKRIQGSITLIQSLSLSYHFTRSKDQNASLSPQEINHLASPPSNGENRI